MWSMEGKCLAIAGMNEDRIKAGVDKFLKEGKDEQVCEDEAFFLIRDNYDAVYVLALHEVVEQVAIIGRLCISQFQNLIHAYKERLDKNHFSRIYCLIIFCLWIFLIRQKSLELKWSEEELYS